MSAQPVAHKRRSPIQVISEWWQSWTGFNPAYSDLTCCAQEEVDRIARDIGVSGSELRNLASLGPDSADLLLKRLQALKLNFDAIASKEPPTLMDLQRICSQCNHHKRCAHDMASDAAAPAWESYCPNASTLKVLTTMPWPARRGQ